MAIRVKSCFCCISLRTGTLILGYMFVVANIIGVTTSAFTIFGSSVLDNMDNNSQIYRNEYVNSTESVSKEDLTEDQELGSLINIMTLFMFMGQFIFVIFLITGAYQGKPCCVKSYLIYAAIMPIATVVLNFLTVIEDTVTVLIVTCICYALEFYFLIVIRSYMLKLRENSATESPVEVYKAYSNPL